MTKHTNDLENEPSGDPSEEYVHGRDGTDPDNGRAGPGDRDDYMDVAAKPVEKGPEQADHSRASNAERYSQYNSPAVDVSERPLKS